MKIDKDVPINKFSQRIDWPFKKMEVGDSVFFDGEIGKLAQVRCHVFGTTKGWKFVTRKDGSGIRVWRVK